MYFIEEETEAQTVKRLFPSASVPPVILSLHSTVVSNSSKSKVHQRLTNRLPSLPSSEEKTLVL